MTAEQINCALAELMAACEIRPGVDALAIMTAIRSAFTLGQDNGQQIILERADQFLEPMIANSREHQIARSIAAIGEWCKKGAYPGQRTYSISPESWGPDSSRVCRVHAYFDAVGSVTLDGSDENEALAKAATWCGERSDTLPPPSEDEIATDPDHDTPAEQAADHAMDLAKDHAAEAELESRRARAQI